MHSAFYPYLTDPIVYEEGRGKETDTFLQIPEATWQKQDESQNGLKNMDRESELEYLAVKGA